MEGGMLPHEEEEGEEVRTMPLRHLKARFGAKQTEKLADNNT